jgi:pimeloyl-ACP methyl ester carboxylesterase
MMGSRSDPTDGSAAEKGVLMATTGSANEITDPDRLAARLIEGLPVMARRLEVAGVSTPLLEGGDGPPIVLVHGQGGFAEIMAPLIRMLVDRYRVVVPDLPGMGRSEIRTGTLDGHRVTEWLGELIAKTCDQAPVVLGGSMGGSIALRLAVERGDELRKVVLVDSGSLGPFRPPPSLLFALIRFIRKPDRAGAARMQRQIFLDADRVRAQAGERLDALEDYQIDRAKLPSVNAANRTLLRQVGTKQVPAEQLRKIQAPVALIWGRQDRVMPFRYAERASAVYGWPLYPIEDSGHLPFVEQPAAFDAALRAILES